MSKIASLEGARGLLALIVFLCHSWLTFIRPLTGATQTDPQRAVPLVASLAVTCFFVLSGFVIALSIKENRRRNGRFDAAEYVSSRLFRILPPLLVTMGITWLLAYALDINEAARLDRPHAERKIYTTSLDEQFVAIFTLGSGGELASGVNGPLWSLVWEIRFYVFAGLIAVAASLKGAWRVAAVAAMLAYGVMLDYTEHVILLEALPFFAYFGLGVCVANAGDVTKRDLLVCASMLVLITVAGAFFDDRLFTLDTAPISLALMMFTALWFAVILLALRRSAALAFLAPVGAVSYTLYILHFPVLQAIYFALASAAPNALDLPNAWISWLCATLLTGLVCVLIARLVERPTQQRMAYGRLAARLGSGIGRS